MPPALAIEALLAAMRARFGLDADRADVLLRPALADWRDAVGCADPLLLPANAKGEPHLLPLPLPSWCAWMIDAGLLECTAPPSVEGPRVVLHAALAVVREAELEGVERFPLVFAGRFAPGAPHVHLALSPPFLSGQWRGPVCIRAAAHRSGPPVRLSVGGPASPDGPSPAASGETVATWVVRPGTGPAQDGWPAGWPRWMLVRLLEGREPQALWLLPALWKVRAGDAPEGALGGGNGAPVAMRLGIDLGSTSTMVEEEEDARSGAPGAKLLSGRRAPSGFRRLAGDPSTAHRFGCGEQLASPAGHLPTAVAAGSAGALRRLLSAEDGDDSLLQVWLPQAGEGDAPIVADRFKSPELLLLSEWLAALPQPSPEQASRTLIEAYGRLLGLALAAAHSTPLVVTEGGRWATRSPQLQRVSAVLTVPQCAWSGAESFQAIFDGVGRALCDGLSAAWASASHALVADPVAARIAGGAGSRPVEALVDFGGLTLQVTVRVPEVRGRPAPFLSGSSMTYLLGGERVLDAAAFAAADLRREGRLRDAFRALARNWRAMISRGESAGERDAAAAAAIRESIFAVVLPLARRQIQATLRRASLDHVALRGAGLRLLLLGEGWKLAALDVPDGEREAAAVRRIEQWFASAGVELEVARIDKRRLCQGALQAAAGGEAGDPAVELHGVDIGSRDTVSRRWFAVAESPGPPGARPLVIDPWWRKFAGGEPSLLRIEQWFAEQSGAFETGLAGGPLGFDAGRSVLKQWLDVSGASLIALRIHQSLAALR